MKTFATLIFTFLSLQLVAQAPLCVTPATESFAALGSDEEFVKKHLDPVPFEHTNQKGSMIEFATPDGKKARAYYVDNNAQEFNYLFVFHEWWGLNDYIKQQVDKLSEDLPTVRIMAIDLYDGKIASTAEEARTIMQQVSQERAKQIIEGAYNFAGNNAEVATLGWCFGGGWALQAGIIGKDENLSGVVMYYGMPEKDPQRLANLGAPVLGIFAKQDGHITPEVVDNFKANMLRADQQLDVHMFDAAHAFANPSNPKYDKEAAQEAYELTIAFLQRVL